MRLPALKISYKVLILVAIPLLFEIGLVCFISVLISDSDQAMERELLSKEIILRAGMVARDAAQGAFSVGTYYYTQSDFFKEHYLNDRKSLQENVNAEERLLLKANKKDQLERLKNIRRLSTDGIEMMDEVMNDTDLRKKGQTGFISQNSLVAIVKSSRIMHALLTETQFVMRNESVYRDQYESITRKAKERIRLAVWAL